jgi:hypothetical protein
MAYTVDWDQVTSFCREKIIPKVKDQYFKSNALMYRLRPKAEIFSGGRNIVQPLSFAPEGGGGQWWSGTDRFDLRIRNPITSAQYWAKNFVLNIVISQEDEDTVNGPEKVLDLVATKMKLAQRTLMDSLGGANGIYNAGTNPKAFTGLEYALPDFTGGAPGVMPPGYGYGGIPSTSTAYTWWNPQGDNTAYVTGPSSTYIDAEAAPWEPWDKMLAMQALASGKTCSMILCNWGVFNACARQIHRTTNYFRPQQSSDLAQAGINALMYRGKDVVVDECVPRDATTKVEKVYFLDEESIHLWLHANRNFTFEGWQKSFDQGIRAAKIWIRGELTFDERRSSGKHSSVNTSATS